MASQDDVREKAQKELFGVLDYSDTGRSQVYTPDGVLQVGSHTFNVEFKTKAQYGMSEGKRVNKTGVSTARGFGSKKVKAWQESTDVFVFSEFHGTDFAGEWKEHHVLSLDDIDPMLEERVLKPFNEGRKPSKRSPGYFGMKEFEEKIAPHLPSLGLSEEDVLRFRHTIEAGASINDPKFPWKEIKERGTQITDRRDLVSFCLVNCKKRKYEQL